MVTRNEGQQNSANEEKFQFVSVPAPDQRRDSKCRRQARSHAVKQGLMKKRKSQQESHQNFHIMRCASTDSRLLHSMKEIYLAAAPIWSPSAGAFDPFESLAVDSSRLRVLLDDYRGRQAPEPVFSVSKPLAFQSFQAVFREGLVDPTLVNAVMLALVSAVTGSKMDKERLGYQQHAIVGIRKRMDHVDEATSETTIGAILLLAGIEARMGRRGQVQLHMGAVQQLLTICKERGIYLTAGIKRAIFWQDLNASILAGSPRLFSHTTFAELQWTRDTFSPSFYRAPPGFAKRRGVFGDEFIEILEDLHALQCIRNIPGAKRGDPLMMAYINNHTASIQSRLGLLRAEGVVARSCRFAAYICSVMLCCTVWCGLFIPSHISEQLFRELNRTRNEEIWEEDLDLMLWLACIGGAFAPEGEVGDGHCGRKSVIRDVAARSGHANSHRSPSSLTATSKPPITELALPGNHATADDIMNNHFAAVGEKPTDGNYEHGVQVIDEDKEFNTNITDYLRVTDVAEAGFNYHLISVFGSQSTGKSTLLNNLFGTEFSVMSETERRQTTKGIWMSKNKRIESAGKKMADNILVMDVEGTDGRERGEDQDFERKSALFALATSEVLIVNIWEHQVGLYQGANMGLLKTVFEVNLQLFLKDKQSTPRSLLFFVIRDHLGNTPLANLQTTLIQDLTKIWTSISKPSGLEGAKIEDYFDFGFAALPHKILQAEKFVEEVRKLGARFSPANRSGSKENGTHGEEELQGGIFLPDYHRRIPADGFSVYAEGIWDQIVHNKDLDLPTQQELLAQFRCDEIAKEVIAAFDVILAPLEEKQVEASNLGKILVLANLGVTGSEARQKCVNAFQTQASRYHKKVYGEKRIELESKIDGRLKTLYQGQLAASHKGGVAAFTDAVGSQVKAGQKAGGGYEFAEIVSSEKEKALKVFKTEAQSLAIQGVPWTNFKPQYQLYEADLDEVSGRLRKEEMRRLATRVERWVKSRLGDAIGVEFNKLGSGRGGSGAPEEGEKPDTEKDLWDRIWNVFTDIVNEAESRFVDRAKSFDASEEEVVVGLWRLRRKSWVGLREKIEEEVMEGNILLKLRENFEDKFRYDEAGVPRIWRPTDDIEGVYTKARESTLTLIPLLSRFRLSSTYAPPDLVSFIGHQPAGVEAGDEEDLAPIGGVDEEEGKSLEEEMTVLSESKRQDLVVRFKKTADGVYVEAKRGAIGGVAQVPLYFYGILLALGWNEIWMVLRNPFLFILLLLIAGGTYVAYTLNLLGPMMQMSNAAVNQGMDIAKHSLREFIANSDMARQALAVPADQSRDDSIGMDTLDSRGKKTAAPAKKDDDDDDI